MSKRFRGILAAVLGVALAGMLAWPAGTVAQLSQAGAYYYFFQAVNENDDPFTTEGAVRCSVYARGVGDNAYIAYTTSALLHNNTTVTFGGQSINGSYQLPLASNSNGIIHWYSALSTPVNLKCFTQYGDYAFKNGFKISDHKVKIDTTGAYKISRFPYVSGSTAIQSTGITIPAGGLIESIAVERVTALRGSPEFHLNVGFAGNHKVATQNALVNTLDLSTPGFLVLHNALNYGAAQNHLGAALSHTQVLGGGALVSLIRPVPYMVHVNSGLDVTYNVGPATTGGLGGHVYIFWRALHVGANGWGLN